MSFLEHWAIHALLAAPALFCCSAVATDTEDQYHLDSGDQVKITVFGPENLSGEFQLEAQEELLFY